MSRVYLCQDIFYVFYRTPSSRGERVAPCGSSVANLYF